MAKPGETIHASEVFSAGGGKGANQAATHLNIIVTDHTKIIWNTFAILSHSEIDPKR